MGQLRHGCATTTQALAISNKAIARSAAAPHVTEPFATADPVSTLTAPDRRDTIVNTQTAVVNAPIHQHDPAVRGPGSARSHCRVIENAKDPGHGPRFNRQANGPHDHSRFWRRPS